MSAAQRLLAGTTATVTELKSRPELNGHAVTVEGGSTWPVWRPGFDATTGRYTCTVGEESLALKPANLSQDASQRFPASEGPGSVADPEYALPDVLDVLAVLEALSPEEYMVAKELAAACLTRCVEALMDGPSDLLPPPRVVCAAHAALRNERSAGGNYPELYTVGCMCLTFVLNDGSGAEAVAAAMVDAAQEALGDDAPSLLELFGASLAQHRSSHELCAISMMGLRQLLGCWVTGDATAAFQSLDDEKAERFFSSGAVGAIDGMLEARHPSLSDVGSLELHEHGVAALSALVGLAPTAARVSRVLAQASLAPVVRLLSAVTPAAAAAIATLLTGAPREKAAAAAVEEEGEDESEEEEEEEGDPALEVIRSSCALLNAIATTLLGCKAILAAGGVAVLLELEWQVAQAMPAASRADGAAGGEGSTDAEAADAIDTVEGVRILRELLQAVEAGRKPEGLLDSADAPVAGGAARLGAGKKKKAREEVAGLGAPVVHGVDVPGLYLY